ncbi:ABC transporter ATP-binding protein [Litoribacterium kuwaitense]|uniref:ABC transporter ATP-binding protein n=1 Tax=Litoribacterium kuwaitense TaxID=1398745 RepID=UPI001BADA35D|nr:ABC transporter ATP-binding protein [Litoribacterium kuwaitense]
MKVEHVIETKGLVKTIGSKNVVNNVDIKVKEGDIYGFLGPNGAGKTTTLRMLLGLIKPSEGQISILGNQVSKDRVEVLKQVGSLIETPSYYGHLSAYENLDILCTLRGLPASAIDEVLNIVDLTKEANRPVKGFSLGMKQRLGIAAALLGEPRLLILDEPTNGLDPAGIQEIRELIRTLPEKGMTVIVSSHLLSEIDQMATQVGILHEGRMLFEGTIEAFRARSSKTIRLRVNNQDKAMQFLENHGFQPRNQEEWIVIRAIQDEELALIIRFLVEVGLSIYRVEEQAQSLESIFLEMTEKGAAGDVEML